MMNVKFLKNRIFQSGPKSIIYMELFSFSLANYLHLIPSAKLILMGTGLNISKGDRISRSSRFQFYPNLFM